MNRLPEQDDVTIRRLLKESGVDESPELLEGLRRLRFFSGTPAPVPTGELAELLSESAEPLHKRPQRRNRGLILSFTLAAAMAAGATGVAASTEADQRLTSESLTPSEAHEAVEGQEVGGKDTESDSQPEPETPASPEAASPEAAFPDTAAAVDSDSETGIPADIDDAALPAPLVPLAPPLPSADVSGPANPSGSSGPDAGADGRVTGVPAPPAGVAPAGAAPRTPQAEDPECEDNDGGLEDSETRGKSGRDRAVDGGSGSDRSGGGRDRGAGDNGRDRGAGDNGRNRAGEPGRDGGTIRDGGGRHTGPNRDGGPRHTGPDFSEGASGRP